MPSSSKPVLLSFPLDYFERNRPVFDSPGFPVRERVRARSYPQRMMRYYIAHSALVAYQAQLKRPMRLVDLGCERGLLKLMAGNEIDATWTGLDWKIGRPSLQTAAYNELHQADFDKPLPVETESADAVVSLHVFEHIPRPEWTAGEVFRILKPGGVFVIGIPVVPKAFSAFRERQYQEEMKAGKRVPGKHINKFYVERATRMLREAGFEIDWVTGNHMFRSSGSFLENSKMWVRLNQLWGGLFPAFGRELYIQAHKPTTAAK